MVYKLIIAGGRDFSDYDRLSSLMATIRYTDVEIVCGKATGADALGERYAKEHGLVIHEFPADWQKNGRAAGPIRNEEMAKFADGCLCFWNGKSRGTKSMIDLARKYNLGLRIEKY